MLVGKIIVDQCSESNGGFSNWKSFLGRIRGAFPVLPGCSPQTTASPALRTRSVPAPRASTQPLLMQKAHKEKKPANSTIHLVTSYLCMKLKPSNQVIFACQSCVKSFKYINFYIIKKLAFLLGQVVKKCVFNNYCVSGDKQILSHKKKIVIVTQVFVLEEVSCVNLRTSVLNTALNITSRCIFLMYLMYFLNVIFLM